MRPPTASSSGTEIFSPTHWRRERRKKGKESAFVASFLDWVFFELLVTYGENERENVEVAGRRRRRRTVSGSRVGREEGGGSKPTSRSSRLGRVCGTRKR